MTLEQIIEGIRPMVANGARPTKERIHVLWAGAKMAREIGAVDTIHRAFMQLIIDSHLIDGRGRWTGAEVAEHVRRYGAEDAAHVIRWALRGWNPFEKGAAQMIEWDQGKFEHEILEEVKRVSAPNRGSAAEARHRNGKGRHQPPPVRRDERTANPKPLSAETLMTLTFSPIKYVVSGVIVEGLAAASRSAISTVQKVTCSTLRGRHEANQRTPAPAQAGEGRRRFQSRLWPIHRDRNGCTDHAITLAITLGTSH